MKVYTATIVSGNSCYLHTLIVVAKNEKEAHDQLCGQQKRKVKYTKPLKELKIDLTTPNVIEYIGWGCSDNNNSYDD